MAGKKKITSLKEFKASFGVNAEVPGPVGGKTTPPGGDAGGEHEIIRTSETAVDPKKEKKGEGPQGSGPSGVPAGEKTPPKQGSSTISQPARVTREDVNADEDLAAMFNGVDLTPEFKAQAKEIFELALVTKINEHLSQVAEQIEVYEEEQTEEHNKLYEQLDGYLDFVVSEWMEDNKLAVDSGIRSEIAESLLVGIKDLFTEHYIDIPETKVDVVEELASKNEKLEESLNDTMNENIELKKKLEEIDRSKVVASVTEGLTDIQKDKLVKLSESVTFSDAESFTASVQQLREAYFTVKPGSTTIPTDLEQQDLTEQNNTVETQPVAADMASYAAAISRTIKR